MENDITELDVDGLKDPKHNIIYMGKATKMDDGSWRCLADVDGALCLVSVNITLPKKDTKNAALFCCSFCGFSAVERKVIIAGPNVNICDECVQMAQDIIAEMNVRPGVTFIKHIETGSLCETCIKCIRPSDVTEPWWKGSCEGGFILATYKKTCSGYNKTMETKCTNNNS